MFGFIKKKVQKNGATQGEEGLSKRCVKKDREKYLIYIYINPKGKEFLAQAFRIKLRSLFYEAFQWKIILCALHFFHVIFIFPYIVFALKF